MKYKYVTPDRIAYDAALRACEFGREWKTAWRLLQTMQVEGIDPDLPMVSVVANACEKGGAPEKAQELQDWIQHLRSQKEEQKQQQRGRRRPRERRSRRERRAR